MNLYILFFISLVFDFKNVDEGGGVFQFVFFALAILSGVLIIMRTPLPAAASHKYHFVGNLLIISILVSFVVALIQEVEIGRFLRIVSPYVLLVLGYFVGLRAICQIGYKKIVKLMIISGCVSTLFTLFYGFISTGLAINEIRYQILSPMLSILVPILANKIFVERKQVLFSVLVMFGILLLLMVSATRSSLIAYFGIVLLAFSISRARSYETLIKGTLRGVFFGIVILAALTPVFMMIFPNEMSRLTERIFTSREIGFDITSATRLAEIDYQVDAWLADIPSMLLGRGLGASYGFSGSNMWLLVDLLGKQDGQPDWWFAGHNFWVYSLFTQGLFIGWIIPFVILNGVYSAWKCAITSRITATDQDEWVAGVAKLCLLILVSFLLNTIGGNPLGSRILSQYIGIVLSLTFVVATSKSLLSQKG